jgi:hypothetical protein
MRAGLFLSAVASPSRNQPAIAANLIKINAAGSRSANMTTSTLVRINPMQIQTISSNLDTVETPAAGAERFLSQIRLFLTFKKAAGKDTAREEFLLDSLDEMHQRLYGKARTAVEVFPAAQIVPEFEHQMHGF